jgi:hypothetical protein
MVLTVGQETSLDAYVRETLRRLPLADATLSLWSFVLQPVFLDGVFACYRGCSFEDTLTFPVFVELIGDALLQHAGSGRQSFTRAHEQGTLLTSIEAVYAKLRRVPLSLSLGFMAESTAHLHTLFPAGLTATELPPSLEGLTVRFFAELRMTRLNSPIVQCTNVMWFDLDLDVMGLHRETNAKRLTNRPMTMSCSSRDLEKQIVLRTNRLSQVRPVRGFRSICCV